MFFLSLMPVTWLVYALFTNQLGANPIELITRDLGDWAMRFLWLTLLVTPLRHFTGWNKLVTVRRMLGLYVFFYAALHVLMYLWLDQFFEWNEILKDIIKRPFITIGFFTFTALIPLVITSNNRMIKRLGGKRWKRLHQISYVIAAATAVHFYMMVKQDKLEPLIYIGILAVLLGYRLWRYIQERA